MPEINQTYPLNSLYIFWILLLYNLFTSNYHYIKLFISKIILFDSISFLIIVNMIGIYLFLKHITFEIHFEISYKY
jgi:hypothetical protein